MSKIYAFNSVELLEIWHGGTDTFPTKFAHVCEAEMARAPPPSVLEPGFTRSGIEFFLTKLVTPMHERNHAAAARAELKQAALAHSLSNCLLFAGLSTADLEAIANISVVKAMDKGAYLFQEGDPCQGFYVVQRGAISVHRLVGEGREQVLHIFRENESFGEGAMTMAGGYPADARAEEPSQVLLIDKAGFLAMLRHKPELALRMMASLAQHNRLLLAQLEDTGSKHVECRLAGWLLRRCPDSSSAQPVVIDLTITKRVLAAELGTVPETFSRALAKLRDLRLVAAQGKALVVLNPTELAAFVRGRNSLACEQYES